MANYQNLYTGCDTGFGHLFAKELNAYGFKIYAGCLFPAGQGAQKLTSDVKYPDKLTIIPLDVCSDESVNAAVITVTNDMKDKYQLWALINNAGIHSPGYIEWGSFETNFSKIFDVNIFGTIRTTRAFLPLIRRCHGRVVNMSSLVAKFSLPLLSSYCMSKTAVSSFSECLRREMYKFGVKVITIEPLVYATELLKTSNMLPLLENAWKETTPDVKEAYGQCQQDFFVDSISFWGDKKYFKQANLNEVSDVIIETLTLSSPENQYVVGGLLAWPLLWIVHTLVPLDLHELSFYVYAKFIEIMVSLYSRYGSRYGNKKSE